MATTSSALFLLVSLLSLTNTKTIATFIDPITIPSCIGHPALLKCAHDIQSAFTGAGSVEIGSGVHTVFLLLDSINAAKASYINVLHFISSNHIKFHFVDSLKSALHIAIYELNDASKMLHGKTTLSSSELHEMQNFLKVAHQNVTKFVLISKHTNTDINLSLHYLIEQSVNLTVLSVKVLEQLNGKVSVESKNH